MSQTAPLLVAAPARQFVLLPRVGRVLAHLLVLLAPTVVPAFGLAPGSTFWWLYLVALYAALLAVVALRRDFAVTAYVASAIAHVQMWNVVDGFQPPQSAYAVGADALIGFGVVPTVRLQAWLGGALVLPALPFYYSYFPARFVLPFFIRHRPQVRTFMLAAMLAAAAVLVVHALVPTAPPWMALHVQHYAPHGTEYGNLVAAMPSGHMAIAVLTALAVSPASRRLRVLVLVYPVLMAFALVYLGEHYVVDIVAGALLAAFCWWAAQRIHNHGSGLAPQFSAKQTTDTITAA